MYILDEFNSFKGGKYDYLTNLAIKCSSNGKYPSYISSKKLKGKNFEGKFNQGVVTINLPQIGIISEGNKDTFWKMLDERLELCKEALMCRHYALVGTESEISPTHWKYGAIARLEQGEKIDKLLYDWKK